MSPGRCRIARLKSSRRLGEALQLKQRMAALMIRLGVFGVLADALGVEGDQFLGRQAVRLDVTVQRVELDLDPRQWGCRWFGRVVPGQGRGVPVEAPRSKMSADRPQVPDMHSRPVMGDYHQPRAIGAEGGSSFHQCTRVWGLEPSDRAARLGLDEAKDLVRLLNQQMAAVGGEGEPVAPHRSASFQVPAAQSRHGDGLVINHFPSGLKATLTSPSTFRSATRRPSAIRQTWAPFLPWLPVASH